MSEQSNAMMSAIAARKWLGLVDDYTDALSASLYSLQRDLDCAKQHIAGLPNIMPLQSEVELLKAALKRVVGDLERLEAPSGVAQGAPRAA